MKYKPHNFSGRIAGYNFCCRCGLVLLKNAATYKATHKTCHPDED